MKEVRLYNDDLGVFISLNTMPYGKEDKFIDFLRSGYLEYKMRIEKVNQECVLSSKFRYCYEPIAYYLWGTYDLALVCLVDDFTLGSRDYISNSNLFQNNNNTEEEYNEFTDFKYQVITGVHKHFIYDNPSNACQNELLTDWLNVSSKSELHRSPKFDFISITSLKINNCILLGVGRKLVDFVKVFLASVINTELNGKGHAIILDCFSWHEITINIFSDDLDLVSKIVTDIRELSVSNLLEYFHGRDKIINGVTYDELERSILHSSFLSELHRHDDGYQIGGNELNNTHVFINSNTNFGYNVDFILNENKQIKCKNSNSKIRLLPRLEVKPGALFETQELFNNSSSTSTIEKDINVLFGDEDAFVTLKKHAEETSSVIDSSFSFEEYLELFWKKSSKNKLELSTTIRKTRTLVFNGSIEIRKKETINDIPLQKHLHKYVFDREQIIELRRLLYQLRISKVVRERVIRMYNIYNDNILDLCMFVYYIDFQPFLIYIVKLVKDKLNQYQSNAQSLNNVHEQLIEITDIFEKCNYNRVIQSYKLIDIPSFSLDFNGGIHQIISAIDTVYKSIYGGVNIFSWHSDIADDKKSKITSYAVVAYLSGNPGIESNQISIRLNYYYVFEPMLFLAVALKEASNKVPFRKKYAEIITPPDVDNDTFFNDYVSKQLIIDEIYKKADTPQFAQYASLLIRNDGKMLGYFMQDALTFHCAYFLDYDLYKFWFWHISKQTPTIYNSDGSFNETVFTRLIIRYFMVLKYTGYLDKETKNVAPTLKLQNLWNKHFVNALEFVNMLFKLKSIDDLYKKKINDTLEHIVDNYSFYKGNATGVNVPKSDIERIDSLFRYANDHSRVNKFDGAKTVIKKWLKESSYIRDNFYEKGDLDFLPIESKPHVESQLGSFVYKSISLLISFHAQLDYTYRVFSNKNDIYNNSMLHRDFFSDDDEKHIIRRKSLSKELSTFDELGGFFHFGYKNRLDSFRYKVDLIESLIDFSLLTKKELFISN